MIIKKTIKITLVVIGTFIGIFLILLCYFNAIRWVDISKHRSHMKSLERQYILEEYTPIDEQSFVGFDLADETIRLNEIRMIASHNSYKKLGSKLAKVFVGLVGSYEGAKAMEYGNPTLTEQLNVGIRSLEIDVRYRSGDFEITHVPLVDNSSVAVKLEKAFREIAWWSMNNPNHIPIIVLIEVKYDLMMLDPFLKEIGMDELILLDEMIEDVFLSRLYTPNDLKGDYASVRERLQTESWPLLKDMLGKVLIVLYPGKMTEEYANYQEVNQQKVMFPAVSNMDVDHDYAAFVVHNTPNVENIQALIAQNLIVRTRMDARLILNEDRTSSMVSGAQIMTTDFHPAHQFMDKPYTYLEDSYLIIKNEYIIGNDD